MKDGYQPEDSDLRQPPGQEINEFYSESVSPLPDRVVMCGSSAYVDIIAICSWLIERDEKKITTGMHLLPQWFCDVSDHIAEHEGIEEEMDT